VEQNTKYFWKSKTFWVSLATIVLPVIPPVAAFRLANPSAYDAALALLFGVVLRTGTTKGIEWRVK